MSHDPSGDGQRVPEDPEADPEEAPPTDSARRAALIFMIAAPALLALVVYALLRLASQ